MNDYYQELCQDIINSRQRIGGEAGNLTVRREGRSNKSDAENISSKRLVRTYGSEKMDYNFEFHTSGK